jgi:hypothetical protein
MLQGEFERRIVFVHRVSSILIDFGWRGCPGIAEFAVP